MEKIEYDDDDGTRTAEEKWEVPIFFSFPKSWAGLYKQTNNNVG